MKEWRDHRNEKDRGMEGGVWSARGGNYRMRLRKAKLSSRGRVRYEMGLTRNPISLHSVDFMI